jgi:hypothetical protein
MMTHPRENKMQNYIIEVTIPDHPEKVTRCFGITAKHPPEAFKLATELLTTDEFIYQILTEFTGCELPQPVYDYLNGFFQEE